MGQQWRHQSGKLFLSFLLFGFVQAGRTGENTNKNRKSEKNHALSIDMGTKLLKKVLQGHKE
jgi:hypothetical protein